MKVLHLITGLGVGGAELQLRSILQHSRNDADVLTLYNPGPVAEMIGDDGVRVLDLGMKSNTEFSALLRLRRLIADGDYDVVHAHLYRSQIYGRPAAWLAGTPVVVSTEHSIGETHLERRRMTLGVRALYLGTERFSQHTIAVSETVRHRLEKWGVRPNRISVIPNGVDLGRVEFDPAARDAVRAEFGLDGSAFVIGVLGRLDPNKRFDMVIEAAAPLLGAGAKLLIVGKGEEGDHLTQVAKASGAGDHITFAGERHDVARVLSAFDLFVASSAQETFGLSVLEALANGLPVLYTTCPALDGLDVSRARQVPGDVPGIRAAIADAIAAGQQPRVPAPEIEAAYGMAAVAGRIDDLYEHVMASSSHARSRARARSRRAGAAPAAAHATPSTTRATPSATRPASSAAHATSSAARSAPAEGGDHG